MIEVTDEMIDRAMAAALSQTTDVGPARYRRILTAALNPPPESETVVTQEMVEAGLLDWHSSLHPPLGEALANAYRAMRKLEPTP